MTLFTKVHELEELGGFYDDMGFKQLRAQLGTTNTQEEEVLGFSNRIRSQLYYVQKDQFLYFEILGKKLPSEKR